MSIGAEFNTQSAAKGIKNHDYTNVSLYGSYDIDAQFQLFARYDVTQSKDDWNEKKDGSLLLGGIQASIHKSFLVALNYRSWLSAQNGVDAVNSIEANTQFSF